MRPVFLLLILAVAVPVVAAPKRVVWEYAITDLDTSRRISENTYISGAQLFLPSGKSLFLEAKNHRTSAYKTYLLNRLGAQGWELVAITGYRESEYRYTFKRQK